MHMQESKDQYEAVCRNEFGEINAKLDRLDVAIRGNGKPGLQLRLDRLEAAERTRGKLIWIVVGAAVTLAVTAVWDQIFGAS
jgi:type IV secretory pathway component VirB8